MGRLHHSGKHKQVLSNWSAGFATLNLEPYTSRFTSLKTHLQYQGLSARTIPEACYWLHPGFICSQSPVLSKPTSLPLLASQVRHCPVPYPRDVIHAARRSAKTASTSGRCEADSPKKLSYHDNDVFIPRPPSGSFKNMGSILEKKEAIPRRCLNLHSCSMISSESSKVLANRDCR